MKIQQLQNKKILIVGYGAEGKATELFLKKFAPNSTVDIVDQKDGLNYLDKQADYDLAVRSPGVQQGLITIPHTTASNIFMANKGENPVIGVTGSKGKSTTASLIHHILSTAGMRSKFVGNIGCPALLELLDPPSEITYFVYEYSSYQLQDILFSPDIAVVTSLFPEHMNYHGSVDKYYQAKHNILNFSKKTDYFVYDPNVRQFSDWAYESNVNSVPFETDFIPKQHALLGIHNASNIRAAITVARLLHISDEISEEAIQSFRPLPHRLQNCGTYRSITFYDDAISTSPESTMAALHSVPRVKTLFLGGEDRGYDFTKLVELIEKYRIENIVLFPTSGETIKRIMIENMTQLPRILQTDTMEDAVRFAYEYTPENTIVLLSTASPSYSLWKNFEQKGEQFQFYIEKLSHEETPTKNTPN